MYRRFAACAALFAVAAVLVAQRAEPASAQGKDAKKEINLLEKQLKAAQADLAAAEKQVASLRQENSQLQTANNKLDAALKKDKDLQATLDGYRGAGLVQPGDRGCHAHVGAGAATQYPGGSPALARLAMDRDGCYRPDRGGCRCGASRWLA